jgi:hypothetical protein
LKFVNEKFEQFNSSGSMEKKNCKVVNDPIEKMKNPKRKTLYGPPDPSYSNLIDNYSCFRPT